MRSMRRVASAGIVDRNSECPDRQAPSSGWNGLESLEGRLLLDGGPTVNVTDPFEQLVHDKPGDKITLTYDATLDGPAAHVDFYARTAPDFPTSGDYAAGSTLIGSQDLTSSVSDNTFVWDTSGVAPGLYFLEAVATDGTNTNIAPVSAFVVLSSPSGNPIATIDTSMGSFQVELDQNSAPLTVANFRNLAESGFYNGLIFHRVISGFMDQGGGFDSSMTEKPTGYSSSDNFLNNQYGFPGIVNENGSDTLSNVRGTIAMARTSDANSATSEFFINDADNLFLDAANSQDGVGYCVFGHVISGMDVIDAINAVDPAGTQSVTVNGNTYDNVPVTPIIIYSVTIQDAVNTAPTFTTRPDATVWNGAGAMSIQSWIPTASAGTGDGESNQKLTYHVTNIDHPELFDVAPAIDEYGVLSFTPNAGLAGTATITVVAQDDGGTANGGQDTSAPVTFTITTSFTSPENTPPVAQDIPGQSVLAGKSLTITLLGSDAETAAEHLTYALGTAPQHGTVDIEGNVATYTADSGYNGPDSFTYIVTDDGIPYGSDYNPASSQPGTVSLAIQTINQAPSFTGGTSVASRDDAGPQTIPGWATDISPGSSDESGQVLTFVVSSDTSSLFASGPAISADGTLTYTPAPGANGTATITYYLHDDGGTANGGQDTSPSQTFTIQVIFVNYAPTFVAGPNQSIKSNSGPQSVPGWATSISPGRAAESNQTVGFVLVNDSNPSMFTVEPAVSAAGTLTYTLAPNATGSATLGIRAYDDGGEANGGHDLSGEQTFTISIKQINHVPTAISQNVTVGDDAGVTITLSGTDLETPASGLMYALATAPQHGTITQLSNDTFRYEVNASYAGTDVLTFTVTDASPDGTTLPSLTSAPAAVYIGGGVMKDFDAANKLAFTGTSGPGLMTLKNGTGSAFFGHSGVCDIGRIFLSGTGDASTLTIASKSKTHAILLGGIDSAAAIGGIVAPTVDISGPISIGKGSGVTLSFGKATAASISTESPIRSLTAASWLRSDQSVAMIQTPTLTKLTVAGDFSGDLAVDTFGGGKIGGSMTGDTLTVNGNVGKLTIGGSLSASTWDVLGGTDVMSIGGDLAGDTWDVTGTIGTLTVAGTADHSSLRSGANMNGITVGASKGSDFLAGIDKSVARTPVMNSQFTMGSTIKAFTVKGLKGESLGSTDFADSNLAAWNLGTINLLDGDFGAAAIRGASGGKVTLVKHTDKANKANNWTYKTSGSVGSVPTGFIRMM